MGGNGVATSSVRSVLERLEPGFRGRLIVPTKDIRTVSDDLRATDRERRWSRLVPAEGGLLPYLTVLGNLVHAHRDPHLSRSAIQQSAMTNARQFGLGDALKRFPYELTPGRRREAGLARAFSGVPKPKTIVLEDTKLVREDAADLPLWGGLLGRLEVPELASIVLLLVTDDMKRATGFEELPDD